MPNLIITADSAEGIFGSGGGGGTEGVLFSDDFSSGDLTHTENGITWVGTHNTSVQTAPSGGGNAIRFRFNDPGSGSSFAEQRFAIPLALNLTDIWVRERFWIPTSYSHTVQGSSNNKGWLYLWSGDYNTGGGDYTTGPGLGPNLWPYGLNNNPTSTQTGESWATFFWWHGEDAQGGHHEDFLNGVVEDDLGKWIEIISHYAYATSANNDGVGEIWKIVDGVTTKVCNIHDGPWYISGQPGFEHGYIWGANNSEFPEMTDIYMNLFEISDSNPGWVVE